MITFEDSLGGIKVLKNGELLCWLLKSINGQYGIETLNKEWSVFPDKEHAIEYIKNSEHIE